MTTIDWQSEATWRAQLLLWGWGITADEPDPREALRNPASILEARAKWDPPFHTWDKKPDGERWHGNRRVPIPDWWALHYLPDDWRHLAMEAESVVEAAERIIGSDDGD